MLLLLFHFISILRFLLINSKKLFTLEVLHKRTHAEAYKWEWNEIDTDTICNVNIAPFLSINEIPKILNHFSHFRHTEIIVANEEWIDWIGVDWKEKGFDAKQILK